MLHRLLLSSSNNYSRGWHAPRSSIEHGIYGTPLAIAPMKYHRSPLRPQLEWSTVGWSYKNTIDCSSYAITLSAAPTTNMILNKNSQRHENKTIGTYMIMAIVNEILWLKMPAMIDVITILYRHHIYDYEYKNACNWVSCLALRRGSVGQRCCNGRWGIVGHAIFQQQPAMVQRFGHEEG